MIKFTYQAYFDFIALLRSHRYEPMSFSAFDQLDQEEKTLGKYVMLRHDVDFDLGKALDMARLEHAQGISSAYLVLLTSPFYNLFGDTAQEQLREILSLGHEIGLHFDEKVYGKISREQMIDAVFKEADLVARALGQKEIALVSMHEPSRMQYMDPLDIHPLLNCYGKQFFKECKYLSDSRLHWREDGRSYVTTERYQHFQILTHPISYDHEERSTHEKLLGYLERSCHTRYQDMARNFVNLKEFVSEEDLPVFQKRRMEHLAERP